jgi:hypothetical protein
MSGHYYFLPSCRQGLAAAIGEAADAQRGGITLTLKANARAKGGSYPDDPTTLPPKPAQLYGPGDILGFQERMVVRTDPKPGVGDFEAEYFPAIEFADADFAWRYTADVGRGEGLEPWIVLVVLEAEPRGQAPAEFTEGPHRDRNLPRHIVVTDPDVLPKLEHSSRWAHVHVEAPPGLEQEEVAALVRDAPEQSVCRLLCPRRLRPNMKYAAFVVPAFELGRRAGMGEPLDGAKALDPAWSETTAAEFKLPYYHRWEFRTGASGDFEHLVRLLEARRLEGLGVRDLDCGAPGFGVKGVEHAGTATLGLEGALKSLDTEFTAWGRDPADATARAPSETQRELETLLNRPDASLLQPPTQDPPSVVPPIYGRWHYGRGSRVNAAAQEPWIHVLNLDPRHRSAAGLGAEVVRRQQEPLMASAWDQLGAIDDANDVLRRAQFGREALGFMHRRLGALPLEDFLGATAAVQKRVLVNDGGQRTTAAAYLSARSRIPAAVLDPAFRHIARRRGPLRRKQNAPRSTDLLARLAAGTLQAAPDAAPAPAGMIRMCDVSRRLRDTLLPTATVTVSPRVIADGGKAVITWRTTNGTSWTAAGEKWIWSNSVPSGNQKLGPFALPTIAITPIVTNPIGFPRDPLNPGGPGTGTPTQPVTVPSMRYKYTLTCQGPGGAATASAELVVVAPNVSETAAAPISSVRATLWTGAAASASLRFCDETVTAAQLVSTMAAQQPFAKLAGRYDPAPTDVRVRGALANWLEKPLEPRNLPPKQNPAFLTAARTAIHGALDPKQTVLARTRRRLRVSGALAARLAPGAKGDALGELMCAPSFPQPMYEPLRDMSHELLLPGVHTIPQNTLGLLETNRRFIESYMCGLNHEFAGELLWREYPTDQRGSYFRQFWDVSEYLPSVDVLNGAFGEWLGGRSMSTMSPETKRAIIATDLATALEELAAANASSALLERLRAGDTQALAEITDEVQLTALVRVVGTREGLRERLRDIDRLTSWQNRRLGANPPRTAPQDAAEDKLVLVVRGELLRKYPDALVYAVDGALGPAGARVPALPEYLRFRVGAVTAAVQDALNTGTIPASVRSALAAKGIEPADTAGATVDVPGAHWSFVMGDARYELRDLDSVLYCNREPAAPVFPTFKASLPPDMMFFGFPFGEEDARAGESGHGKYFIVEERVGEPRFALDPGAGELRTWDDVAWSHFELGDSYGAYLDDSQVSPEPTGDDDGRPWDGASSATRAWITLQRPVRVAVHAQHMLPTPAGA